MIQEESSYLGAVKYLIEKGAFLSLSQLASTILRTLNSGFLARLGPSALIAANPVSTATSLYTSFNAILFCLANCIQSELTLAKEAAKNEDTGSVAKHNQAIGSYFRQGLTMSLILAAGASTLGYFSGEIFAFLGHDAAVADVINGFFRPYILSGGMFPIIAQAVERRLMTGLERPIPAAVLTVAPTALSLAAALTVLNQSWGIEGFGYGFALSNWATFLGFLVYVTCDKSLKPYSLFDFKAGLDFEKWHEIFKKGLSSLVSTMLECLIVTALSGVIANAGNDAALAYSIANLWALILVIPIWGLGAVSSTRLGGIAIEAGTNVKNPEDLVHYRKKLMHQFQAGVILAGCVTTTGYILYLAIPDPLIQLFVSNPLSDSQLQLTKHSLWVASAGSVAFDSMRVLGTASARVFNRNYQSAAFNFIGLIIGLMLAVLSEACVGLGALGMIVGFYLGVGLAATMQCIDIHRAIVKYTPPQFGLLNWGGPAVVPIAENQIHLLPAEAPESSQSA